METISLFELPTGVEAIVQAAARAAPEASDDADLLLRLREIGFVEGERVCIVARGFPGGDPLAVRVGNTMFALRRGEASQVTVSPLARAADRRQ